MHLLSGSSNLPLAKKLISLAKGQMIDREIKNFADKEIKVKLKDDKLKNQHITILETLSNSDQLIELCLLIDAAKNEGAKKISVIIPYLFYSRQDKPKTGEPFSPNVIIKILENSGIDHITCLDLHSEKVKNKFAIPVKHLGITKLLKEIIKEDFIVVAPDAGGTKRAEAVAQHYKLPLLHIEKKRLKDSKVIAKLEEETNIKGKQCLLVDDIIDSGNTLCEAANTLHDHGVKSIQAFCTHAVLSGNAIENIEKSNIDKLFVTNSINPTTETTNCKKISIIDIATLIHESLK